MIPKYNSNEYKSYDVGFHNPGLWIRPAIITAVHIDKGLVDIEWLDYPGVRRDVELTQPQLGIFQMPVIGTVVLVGFSQGFRAKILRHIPVGYGEQIQTDTWAIDKGELLLQSYVSKKVVNTEYPVPTPTGTNFFMSNIGDIIMNTSSGDSWAMYNSDNEIVQNSMNFTCITEAGKLQYGIVKRTVDQENEFISTEGGPFTTSTVNALTEFRLSLLETADTNPDTDPEVDTAPFIELTLGTKVDNSGNIELTNSGTHAVGSEEIMIQLKTKADQGFEFTVDKKGNLTVIVKGDVKFKVDGNADINVSKEAKVVAGDKVEIDAPHIEVGGTTGIVLDTFLKSYDTHTHTIVGTMAAGPPIIRSLPSHKSKKATTG